MRVRAPRLVVLLTIVFLAAPLAAGAQQASKVWRIGWVSITGIPLPEAFSRALNDRGWLEGRNVVFENRYVSSPTGIHEAAEELVRARVDIILTASAGNAEQIL